MSRIPHLRAVALASTALALWAAPFAGGVRAQESEGDAGTVVGRPAPVAVLMRSNGDAEVDIDGRLDEAVWAEAPALTGFTQGEPVEGIPAEHDTDVRIVFTEDAILVAARMWDARPEEIGTQLYRRDGFGAADWIMVGFDTDLDRRTGYVFQLSAAGVQGDEYLFDDLESDRAWNAVWISAVQRDEQGWTAELRIPLSQLRYEAAPGAQSWGVNIARRRIANNETSYYSLRSRTQAGVVSQFGQLDGVVLERPVRRIEARPYILSSLERAPAEAGNPFFDGSAGGARVGTDLRFGIGSAFTLDATLNPDFGQVESDPAQINLSAFELFFPEQRPFFVQDANLLGFELSGRNNSLFYSRRIGRRPSGGSLAGADFEDEPTNATILGAAKLTGRTSGGLSVGALFAATADERGEAFFADDQSFESYPVEPAAQHGVVRVQQDFNGGASQVNAIVTGMRRGLPGDGSFDRLPSSAFSGGAAFEHQWNDRTWALIGRVAGSNVRGDSTAMIRLQRASNHFWQRPDATREEMDSTATSMSGAEWRLQLDKRRGQHWTGGIWAGQVTHGFEINDLGFSRNRERLDLGARIQYREIQPVGPIQEYGFNLWNFHNWSHEALDDAGSIDSWRRAYTNGRVNFGANATFLNQWGVELESRWVGTRYSRSETRGGPVMVDPGELAYQLRFNSDRRKSINVEGGMEYVRGDQDSGNRLSLNAGLELRPTPAVEIQLNPSWTQERDAAQYVTQTGTLPFEPTFGRRYLFGELERRTLAMETRVDVTFSPTLTFQLFAQPFISTGDYLQYRQLAAPGSFAFVDFEPGLATAGPEGQIGCLGGSVCRTGDGRQHFDLDFDGVTDWSIADQDFNFRSLLGNAVLRWEYRPGSTIFFVWQRQQQLEVNIGDFDVGRDLDALFAAPAQNVFIIKFDLWLGL